MLWLVWLVVLVASWALQRGLALYQRRTSSAWLDVVDVAPPTMADPYLRAAWLEIAELHYGDATPEELAATAHTRPIPLPAFGVRRFSPAILWYDPPRPAPIDTGVLRECVFVDHRTPTRETRRSLEVSRHDFARSLGSLRRAGGFTRTTENAHCSGFGEWHRRRARMLTNPKDSGS